MSELPTGTSTAALPAGTTLRRESNRLARELVNEDLDYCVGRLERIESQVEEKVSMYERRILELLEEKRQTEALKLELRALGTRLSRTKTLTYAASAAAALALARSFF
ncbi:MAG: hypothetical protein CVU79_01105 [Elusimicrobia bacterium HGW-Elusimicrobia-3]|nr:MAG: hypothetical protein CVU79_01105 [Elusimicrobia bacterium HGW-Elusimicrobia-3]